MNSIDSALRSSNNDTETGWTKFGIECRSTLRGGQITLLNPGELGCLPTKASRWR
jgi:hypothetical protein